MLSLIKKISKGPLGGLNEYLNLIMKILGNLLLAIYLSIFQLSKYNNVS